jgi:hypothetical protein
VYCFDKTGWRDSVTTPEKKVKDKVKKILAEFGAYYFMPATGGYGKSGVPDLVACIKGRFIGIECKANGGVPTALQEKNLTDIMNVGGIAVIVDETGIEDLKRVLQYAPLVKAGVLFELIKVKETK